MKYVIADKDDNGYILETLTSDPINYLRSYEPIDVVNGKVKLWDENGDTYILKSAQSFGDKNKKFSVVNVGEWREDDPWLIKTSSDAVGAKNVVIKHLTRPSSKKFFTFGRKSEKKLSYKTNDLDKMSLKELFKLVES